MMITLKAGTSGGGSLDGDEEGGIPGFGISLVVGAVVVVSLFRRRL